MKVKYLPEWICLIAAQCFAVSLLFDYTSSTVFFEYPEYLIRCALVQGESISILDYLTRPFNTCLDGYVNRIRFFNGVAIVINENFRHWLFQHFPWHPTLSVSVIAFLLITPWLAYKLFFAVSKNRGIALISVAFMTMSLGYLSSVSFYSHPAKPFSLIATLVLLLIYWHLETHQRSINKSQWLWKSSLLIFLSLMWDESFVVVFFILPLLFHRLFFRKHTAWVSWAPIAIAMFFTAFFLQIILKPLSYQLHGQFFNLLYSTSTLTAPYLDLIRPDFMFSNWKVLLMARLLPWWQEAGVSVLLSRKTFFWMATVLFHALAVGILVKKQRHRERIAVLLLTIPVFAVFMNIYMLMRGGRLIYADYYYGSHFTVYFSLLVCLLISSFDSYDKKIRTATVVVFFWTSVVCLTQFERASIKQVRLEDDRHITQSAGTRQDYGTLTYQQVKDVWLSRHNPEEFQTRMAKLPKNAWWLIGYGPTSNATSDQ